MSDLQCVIWISERRSSHERSRRSKIDLDAAEATVTLDYRYVPANSPVSPAATFFCELGPNSPSVNDADVLVWS